MSPSSSPSSLVFPSILSSFLVSLLFFLFLASPFLLTATRDTNQRRCIHEQFTALLDLKLGFNLAGSLTSLSSWNLDNSDCCSWEGITCNTSTGHVTGLDLSSLRIYGLVDFKSLFRLQSLQRLDLSDNFFDASPIPSGFHQLASLTHLNLARCSFYGQIPLHFSRLTRLVSLDLSYNQYIPEDCNSEPDDCGIITLSLKNLGLRGLLQNLPSLRGLHLDWVDLSTEGSQWSEALSYAPSDLRRLSMSNCRLSGSIHPPLSPLRLATHIDLSGNNLCSSVPDVIANFTSLTYLNLQGCCLHSEFPQSIFNLPRIQTIDISLNPLLTGSLPEFSPNSSIQELSMQGTAFYGKLPYSLGNLKSLTVLSIRDCNLSGPVPQSFVKLSQLATLDLSNNSLSGPMPQSFMNFSQLAVINLSRNMLSGPIPSALFSLPLLYSLHLSYNHFNGELGRSKNASSSRLAYIELNDNNLHGPVPSSLFEFTKLFDLDLSSNNFSSIEFRNLSSSWLDNLSLARNNLHGPIPKIIFELTQLDHLNLSSNNFSGVMDLGLFHKHRNLEVLDLSHNSLTAITDRRCKSTPTAFPQLTDLNLRSCSINKFPDVLRNQERIMDLDLSSNEISGKIPQWIWKVALSNLNLSHNAFERIEGPFLIPSTSLIHLDLSFNKLKGLIPIPSPDSVFFSISNNKFSGDVPSQICNATSLEIMDLSNNNFTGWIPKCLGRMSDVLDVLKLRGNNFSGRMLQEFKDSCKLRTFDLNANRLEGHLPKSLANCKTLEVLDLGNNRIYGAFPVWLKDLPQLRVLVLRSNQFQGTLGYLPTDHDFPQLQIFDISFNNFTGRLPFDIFKDWKAMMVNNKSETLYLGKDIPQAGIYYEDTVTVVGKGNEMQLVRILTAFTLLDLSNNKFDGGIPTSVGDLRSLHIINMSHNCFTGRIPASMGDIRELESLDLSQNQLSGEIPWQLAKLPWLEVLNLSQNLLVGRIPQGPQFNTFANESFQGNLGLCGLPLSKKCEEEAVSPPPPTTESEGEYDWEFMWIGFGIGHGVGLGILIWTLALWRKGRIAFFTFADRMLSFVFPPAVFSCLQPRPGNRRRNRRPRLTI